MFLHTGILHRMFFPSMIWRMPGKKIYITFDDGPHSITPLILDVLNKHSVRATFFLSGKNIIGREEIVKRISTEGHSIGIHAFNHSRFLALSKERTKKEIEQTSQLLSQLIPQNIRFFRPPFGFFSWNTIAAARELGFFLIMWSCLTGDFYDWTNERIVNNVIKNLSGGSILVFHDNDLTQEKIVSLLNEVIPKIKYLGFEFGAIR
ncbi:MAG: polysaccharide deacetylase family protein [Bacteroidota bacterium]|nr:polysaccharide deacetylase family protein [Bacteroidota bacterium]